MRGTWRCPHTAITVQRDLNGEWVWFCPDCEYVSAPLRRAILPFRAELVEQELSS